MTVVLITGSNSGIGHAVAEQAVQKGLTVYGGARRRETFAAIEAVGATPLWLDVMDETSMQAAVSLIEARHGAVDILVNNAGYGQMGAVEEIPLSRWRVQYETNVFGLVRLTQLVIPAMRARGRGRILNVSSMGGEFTFPLASAYHSTKYAVESINDALRFELHPFGIQVISIQPGAVATPLAAAVETLTTPPDSPYARQVAALHRLSGQSLGYLTAAQVARVVVSAMTAQRPRTRYKIGWMAHLMTRTRALLGDRQWDGLLRQVYG